MGISSHLSLTPYLFLSLFFKIIFLIAVLSATASAPFNVCVDILFETILAAPLAEEFTVNIRAQTLQQQSMMDHAKHVQRHKNTHLTSQMQALAPMHVHPIVRPRGSVRHSIALGNTTTTPLFVQALPTTTATSSSGSVVLSPDSTHRNQRFSRLLSYLVVPNAFIRHVPPSIIASREALVETLYESFQQRHTLSVDNMCSYQRPVQPVRKMKTRMTVVRMSMMFGKGVVGVKPSATSALSGNRNHRIGFDKNNNKDNGANSDPNGDEDANNNIYGIGSDSDSGDEEKGKEDRGVEQSSPFACFVRNLSMQHAGLGRDARLDFQQRWG